MRILLLYILLLSFRVAFQEGVSQREPRLKLWRQEEGGPASFLFS